MKSCFLIKRDLVVVYVYPVFGPKFDNYANRFVGTYLQNHSELDHRLVVVSNGGQPTKKMREIFEKLPVTWIPHDNLGYDIGAFQFASRTIPCELMVFLGNSAYIRHKCWLDRVLASSDKHGLALYGCMGNKGDLGVRVWPHIRTTGWWIAPELLNHYPLQVYDPKQRYEFEHGQGSISQWVTKLGLKCWVVTVDNEYEWADWDSHPNGYLRGDQSALLTGDHMTEPPFHPIP